MLSNQFDRQINNMNSMMAMFGIGPRVLPSNLLGSAMHACLDCPSSEVCHDWLAQTATSPRLAPDFCPNAQVFEHVRDSQLRGNPAPGRDCKGSLQDVGWEGRRDDPGQPKEICCSVCGAKMKPEFTAYVYYEFEDKDDIYWASVPAHLPGKRPKYY